MTIIVVFSFHGKFSFLATCLSYSFPLYFLVLFDSITCRECISAKTTLRLSDSYSTGDPHKACNCWCSHTFCLIQWQSNIDSSSRKSVDVFKFFSFFAFTSRQGNTTKSANATVSNRLSSLAANKGVTMVGDKNWCISNHRLQQQQLTNNISIALTRWIKTIIVVVSFRGKF